MYSVTIPVPVRWRHSICFGSLACWNKLAMARIFCLNEQRVLAGTRFRFVSKGEGLEPLTKPGATFLARRAAAENEA
ncbi:hypothetical protein [Pseudogulbenkiania subflava]|uniref:Uncharacterized protein n=1 Tax=Pseudogulbenkiania subflava DSM 22618 TaxID=1123014 RepID=A0A1Y6C711_9NEIS|nr:hypothetical protein [Pseudogulbenkiania subflava]SMF40385.1 hypothetical protein SAMN02745746_03042 [Pseudogulbenkiania subflava DSM 22618]